VVEDYRKNQFVDSEVEDYYSLIFVLKGKAYVTDENIKVGETILKVGDMWPVKNPNYALHALITKIEIH